MVKRTNFSRYEFPEVIDERGYKHAVEVGVNLGQFSYHLLKYSKLKRLWSVDAFRGRFKNCERGARTLLEPYIATGRCTLSRLGSVEAAERLRENRVFFSSSPDEFPVPLKDFVYIDAAHDYASVAADIAAWYPLVRPGGMLCGHDYCDAHRNGVIQAVDEFAAKTGLELTLTREAWASWMFTVPG